MPETPIILHSPGSIPGIPGSYGTGSYLVNYEARTIRPMPDPEPEQITPSLQPAQLLDIASEVTQLEDEIKILSAEEQQAHNQDNQV